MLKVQFLPGRPAFARRFASSFGWQAALSVNPGSPAEARSAKVGAKPGEAATYRAAAGWDSPPYHFNK